MQKLGLVRGAQNCQAPLLSQLLPCCRYLVLPSRSVRAKLFFPLSFFWGGCCTGVGAKHDMLGLNFRKALEHLSAA